jgi:hypothetical protein
MATIPGNGLSRLFNRLVSCRKVKVIICLKRRLTSHLISCEGKSLNSKGLTYLLDLIYQLSAHMCA